MKNQKIFGLPPGPGTFKKVPAVEYFLEKIAVGLNHRQKPQMALWYFRHVPFKDCNEPLIASNTKSKLFLFDYYLPRPRFYNQSGPSSTGQKVLIKF